MYRNPTNLLPEDRQKRIARAYAFRFVGMGVVLAMGVLGLAAVLLIPTYFVLDKNMHKKESELTRMQSATSAANEAALSIRLRALDTDVNALMELSKKQTVSEVLQTIVAVARPGITLSGIAYSRAVDGKAPSAVLSGKSNSREALRAYQVVLQKVSGVRSVELPISAFAKETDIAFTITLTFTP